MAVAGGSRREASGVIVVEAEAEAEAGTEEAAPVWVALDATGSTTLSDGAGGALMLGRARGGRKGEKEEKEKGEEEEEKGAGGGSSGGGGRS